jgi:hypothetical protein
VSYRNHLELCHRGLVSATDPGLLENGQSPASQNMEFGLKTARKRRGSRKLTSTAVRGGAVKFDAVSGWVYFPYNGWGLSQGFGTTIEFTVKLGALSVAGVQVLLSLSDLSQLATLRNTVMISQEIDTGIERFVVRFTDIATELTLVSTNAANLVVGQRYHIAFTFDNLRQNLLVFNLDTGATHHATGILGIDHLYDGQFVMLLGAAGRTPDGQVDFTSATFVNDKPIDATIDELRIWAAVLASGSSPSTALTTYQNRELDLAHPNAGFLTGYWKFNDRNGVSAVDVQTAFSGGAIEPANQNGFLEPFRPHFRSGLLPDEQGYALQFDGYIDHGIAFLLSTNAYLAYTRHFAETAGIFPLWCLEFSFKLLESALTQTLFSWTTSSGTTPYILLLQTDGTGKLTARISASENGGAGEDTVMVTGATVLSANTTYHVAVRSSLQLTGTARRLYTIFLNGVSNGTGQSTANFTLGPPIGGTTIGNMLFAADTQNGQAFYNVEIDEIRLWSAAQTANSDIDVRSADKIKQYYDKPIPSKEKNINVSTIGTPDGAGWILIDYWTCDDNHRDYNDAVQLFSNRWYTGSNLAAADSGTGQRVGTTNHFLGGVSIDLNPGSHAPEFAPGLLSGAVQGGLVDGMRAFKKSDGTQQVVITAEGSIQTLGSDVMLPATLTTQLAAGFQGGQPTSFIATGDQLYLTNGLSPPLVWDGTSTRRWGLQGPTKQPAVFRAATASSTAGDVQYRYTYVSRQYGLESNPSPPSAIYRDTGGSTAIGVGPFQSTDPQVDTIRLYRTTHGASSGDPRPGSTDFFFLDEITNDPTTGGLGVLVNYIDTVSDAQLGPALSSAQGFLKSGPPPWTRYAAFFNGRMFMAYDPRDKKTRQQVFFSESLMPENFGVQNFLTFESGEGEPVNGLFPFYDRLAVFKRTSIYALSGFGPEDFRQAIIDPTYGTFSGHSFVYVNPWLYFLSDQGPCRFDGTQVDWIGRDIIDTWTDFDKTSLHLRVAGHHKDSHQVWWGLRNTSSSTSNDRCLVYDYQQGTFSVYSGLYPQSMHGEVDSQGNNRLLFGDDNGFIWRADMPTCNNDGDLGFAGTTSGTLTAGGTNGGYATVTVTGNPTGTGDNWKGLRIELTKGAATSEARILHSPTSGGVLTLDKTVAQLGFTPDNTTAYRIAAIDAYYDTRPIALVGPGDFARVEEVELDGKYSTDQGANANSVTTVTLSVANYKEYATTAEDTLSQAQTVGNAASVLTEASTTDRWNLKSRAKRYAIRIANDRPHEGFEVRDVSVRFVPQERT